MLKNLTFSNVNITGGFWQQRQTLNRESTVHSVYNRFVDTGRFDAFRCDWREGMPNKPHIFWDSDVAKWIEGAAYLLEKQPNAELESIIDNTVALIAKNQCSDGYFNIYYQTIEPSKRWSDRNCHELYCAGHLIEAACAYYHATGKDLFLKCMCKYADYIEQVFKIEHSASFSTPGHEELELALVKLYQTTGEPRYLALSKHFIDTRGTVDEGTYGSDYGRFSYCQSHLPVREQTTAEGHSVRAAYLYTGMADIAYHCNDADLLAACKTLFRNILEKRMYVTGGIGSSPYGEAFTLDYDLPNLTAYSESCAAIGLAYFANRMQQLEVDSVYADTIERILYNGFLSTTSLDGKSFFYVNPLEIRPELLRRNTSWNAPAEKYPITQRQEVFGCSCCPPNILRFAASLGSYLYTLDEESATVYCHQYMTSEAAFSINGQPASVTQETNYPTDGKILLTYHGPNATLATRIPGWAEDYTSANPTANGYELHSVTDGSVIELNFAMPVRFLEADPRVQDDAGRYAISRGPLLFCMESVDNGAYLRDVRIAEHGNFTLGTDPQLGTLTLTCDAYRRDLSQVSALYSFKHDSLIPFRAKLIPYYAFANRGETEMVLWTLLF